MDIEHIVISGGGQVGLSQFGALKYLVDKKFLDLNKIKSIYATSVGAFIGISIALKNNLEIINNYIINRPWKKEFEMKISSAIFNIISFKGIYDETFFETILSPVLFANNMQLDVTLKDFCEKTSIDLHLITSDFNKLSPVDINCIDFPDIKLITAVHMSCALPILFTPKFYNENFYVDGGLTNNYPVDLCISNNKLTENETHKILAFKNLNKDTFITKVNENSSFYEIFTNIVRKFSKTVHVNNDIKIENCVSIFTNGIDINSMTSMLTKEGRQSLVDNGIVYVKLFLQYKNLV